MKQSKNLMPNCGPVFRWVTIEFTVNTKPSMLDVIAKALSRMEYDAYSEKHVFLKDKRTPVRASVITKCTSIESFTNSFYSGLDIPTTGFPFKKPYIEPIASSPLNIHHQHNEYQVTVKLKDPQFLRLVTLFSDTMMVTPEDMEILFRFRIQAVSADMAIQKYHELLSEATMHPYMPLDTVISDNSKEKSTQKKGRN